jgi:putative protease
LVDARVVAKVGEPLEVHWTLGQLSVTVMSDEPLGPAESRAITEDLLRDQLGRLGNTPYELRCLEFVAEGVPFVPVSLLNQLRRDAVERLKEIQSRPRTIRAIPVSLPESEIQVVRPPAPALHLLVRSPEQLNAALDCGPASITLDYLDLYGLRPSLERVKASGIEARVASPRVLKPGEERIADFLLRCECPILVRSAGLLEMLQGHTQMRLDGDFSLNAANAMSAGILFERGIARLAPTHDLNAMQVAELARRCGANRLEAIAYQHLPVFHTEHCVFCRFLSTGTSYKDCGRPCEHHRVSLRDTNQRAHPVMADVGCRNTVFGAEAQEASAHMQSWLDAGIGHYRLEFVHESPDRVQTITTAFREFLIQAITPAELRQRLKQLAPEGTTEGSLFVPGSAALFPVLR